MISQSDLKRAREEEQTTKASSNELKVTDVIFECINHPHSVDVGPSKRNLFRIVLFTLSSVY